VLEADLVVDATGRGSRSPLWLEELGYPRPAQDEVRIGVAYASRIYRWRPDHLDGDRVVLVAATKERPCGGVMPAMEGDRWMVTLNGYLGRRPPADPDGFVAFAAGLPVPDIFEVIRDAEPLGEVLPARYPASVRRPHGPPQGPARSGHRPARPARQPATRRHTATRLAVGVTHPAEAGGLMTATLTKTILSVDRIRSPMLQTGPPPLHPAEPAGYIGTRQRGRRRGTVGP
jgi:hypothetical protein